jgi:hypothetical protein
MKTIAKFMSASLLILFVFSTAQTLAQGKVNFTGTWAINESKSPQPEGGFRMGANSMTITQDGVNLTMESTRPGMDGENVKTTSKFTTDGKESSNPAGFGNSTRKSVLTWSADGKTLNFTHTMKFDRDGESMEFKTTEMWTMPDDKTLSVITVMNMQGEERKTTIVYDKK